VRGTFASEHPSAKVPSVHRGFAARHPSVPLPGRRQKRGGSSLSLTVGRKRHTYYGDVSACKTTACDDEIRPDLGVPTIGDNVHGEW